jgi:hypothetical protein
MVGIMKAPSSVHNDCKKDYIDERYHQFSVPRKRAVSSFLFQLLYFLVSHRHKFGDIPE